MSKQPASAGKIVGITCGSLFAAFILLPSLVALAGFGFVDVGSIVWTLLIAGGVIFLIRRDRKKRYAPGSEYQTQPDVTAAPVTAAAPTPVSSSGGALATTVCQHSFNPEDLEGKTTVTCPCGYTFKTKDLLDYQKLSDSYLRIERDLLAVRKRLVASSNLGTPVAAAQTVRPAATPAPAPKIQPVRKEKKTLSLQQWLIMGASAIIVIAGSIFVSTNLDTFPEEGFLAVTLGVSIITGLLAFWGRKF